MSKISQIVVQLDGKTVDINGTDYTVKSGALWLSDSEEKFTPRKLGTTWNEIFEKSGLVMDEKKGAPAPVESILEEVEKTEVAVEAKPKPEPKARTKSTNPAGNSGSIEYYTTPTQKEFLIELFKSSENETVAWLYGTLVEKKDKASAVKVTAEQVQDIYKEFESLIEGSTDKRIGALRKKHEALMSR